MRSYPGAAGTSNFLAGSTETTFPLDAEPAPGRGSPPEEPTMKRTLCAVGLGALCLMWAAPGVAQPVADHLKCYKARDTQAKAVYKADLGGLVAEPGCLIKVPGNLLCVEATKTGITPTPPGGPDNTGPAGRFLCYKVKCPKAAVTALQWHDQFGTRTVTPSTPKIVCAPEIL